MNEFDGPEFIDEETPSESADRETPFSWENWLLEGLSHARQTLFRYNFGLPDEFWRHLENAARELLAAARILLRTLLSKRSRGQQPPPEEKRGPIDIQWD
ncbi:MAG: hypothetical protein GXP42_15860 [Chloroflexi bacterium]|nr:hypothetical protein [Chloroflexota bacterium]